MSQKVIKKPSKSKPKIKHFLEIEKTSKKERPGEMSGIYPRSTAGRGGGRWGPILPRNKVSHESSERTEG